MVLAVRPVTLGLQELEFTLAVAVRGDIAIVRVVSKRLGLPCQSCVDGTPGLRGLQ